MANAGVPAAQWRRYEYGIALFLRVFYIPYWMQNGIHYGRLSMPSMTIKRIPAPLYHSLKRSASTHHRSLNGEAIACLERSLGLTQPTSDVVLERIDAIRKSLTSIKLTDRFLRAARSSGRP
jgi:plasmid stability protein